MPKTIFVTGANRGIGLEFVRQYAKAGWRVIATCRSETSKFEQKIESWGDIRVVQLDVSCSKSIKELVKTIGDLPIDILCNNAGVGDTKETQQFGKIEHNDARILFDVNVLAPLKLVEILSNNIANSYECRITSVCKQALEHINNSMCLEGVDIIIYNHPEQIIPELGASGGFLKKDQVEIYLDVGLENFEHVLTDIFPPMLAHELHHWKRWKENVFGNTLLDALITEGMAVHFENELFPNNLAFYANVLSGAELIAMEFDARQHFSDSHYDHNYWFFGSKPDTYKKWSGYSLGYYLLEKHFIKNPNDKASNIYDKPSREFQI